MHIYSFIVSTLEPTRSMVYHQSCLVLGLCLKCKEIIKLCTAGNANGTTKDPNYIFYTTMVNIPMNMSELINNFQIQIYNIGQT